MKIINTLVRKGNQPTVVSKTYGQVEITQSCPDDCILFGKIEFEGESIGWDSDFINTIYPDGVTGFEHEFFKFFGKAYEAL